MSWELIVKQSFSAAHFLNHYQGKCERMHGHTFEVEARFAVDRLQESGISIDFTEIKHFLRSILPDHQVLNEVVPFSPSAEQLARLFFQKLAERYPVRRVIVWESADAGAEYTQDQ